MFTVTDNEIVSAHTITAYLLMTGCVKLGALSMAAVLL
jgi:hypothetical protein